MKRLLPFLLLLSLLGGCSKNLVLVNAGEIEDFEIVQTVGVDLVDGKLLLTAAVGADSEGKVGVLVSRGQTVRRAMQSMQERSEKKYIFFGETQSFLIGEGAASRDISVYLETVERGIDMRLDTKVYIVRGSTAAEAITAASTPERSVNERLRAIEEDVHLSSECFVTSVGQAAESLAEDGCAILAALELAEREEVLEEGAMTVQVPGYALIRKGVLRGFVTGDEARGLTLLNNEARMDIVEVPDGAGGLASVELTGADCRFEPVFEDGRLTRLRVLAELRGNVAGMEHALDLYDPAVTAELERSFASVEAARMEAALARMCAEGQDLIGAGRALERAHPILFRRCCAADWPAPLMEAELSLEVTACLERTYDLGISPASEETEERK